MMTRQVYYKQNKFRNSAWLNCWFCWRKWFWKAIIDLLTGLLNPTAGQILLMKKIFLQY